MSLSPRSAPHPRAAATAVLLRRIATLLTATRTTVAVAESCTAGGAGWALTARSGSSAYFRGGVITYANDVKQALLNVPGAMLRRCGAVSKPVAECMAREVRRRLASDYGVAITGIAGPSGGTPRKPVGTVWLAVASPRRVTARLLRLSGSRAQVRRHAVRGALELLLAEIYRTMSKTT